MKPITSTKTTRKSEAENAILRLFNQQGLVIEEQ
jgi:hypothetical protein